MIEIVYQTLDSLDSLKSN